MINFAFVVDGQLIKNRQSRTTCSYFCRREIKNRNGLVCNPDKTKVDNLCSCFHSITLPGIDWCWRLYHIANSSCLRSQSVCWFTSNACCPTMLTVCASPHSFQFFFLYNIGRIGKYLDHDKCFLLYLKLKLSFMGTDCSLPALLDFGMHYR